MQNLQQVPAETGLRPKGMQQMLDSVKVSSDTFTAMMFMGCAERKEFTRENIPNSQKPQKRTAAGVPLWSLSVAVVSWRGASSVVPITVPMHDDPASKFRPGDPVQLDGLVFGVTPKQNGGFVTWWSADAVAATSAASAQRAS